MTIDEIRAQYAQALTDMRAADGKDDEAAFTEAETRMSAAKAKLTRAEKLGTEERWGKQAPEDDKPPTDTPEPPETRSEPPCPRLYRNLGEQLVDVVRAGRGHAPDKRLLQLNDYEARVSGMSEGVPADGGWMVQTDSATELIKTTWETNVLAGKCRTWQLSTNANSMKVPAVDETSRATGSRWGGVQVYWETEGESTTGKKIKLSFVRLELKKMKGVAYLSSELLEDAPLMQDWVNQAFPEEMGFMLDDAIFRGDGASQPLGFTNAACLVTVAKRTNQVEDTILAENVIDMWARVAPSCKPRSIWLINSEVMTELPKMTINVGTGGSVVYMPAGGLAGLPYGTLYGRPVLEIEQASALGDVGDICCVDLTQYYLARKRGVQAATSIHVKFVEEETALRWSMRVDGQPAWKSALTPYKAKSGNTISPFVTLAARA